MELMNIPTPTELRKESITARVNKVIEVLLAELRISGTGSYTISKGEMTEEMAEEILTTVETLFNKKGYKTGSYIYARSNSQYGYVHVIL